jgi:N utilization substance protein A
LAPARVREVRLDEETGTATVIVSDFQLSLAIGKEGQNARLAARLTGWRIDIKSETQLAEEEAGFGDQEWAEGEWVEDEKGDMVWKPAEGGEAMSAAEWSHAVEDAAESGDGAKPAAEAGDAPVAGAEEAGGAAEAEPATAVPAAAEAAGAEASEVTEEAEA